MMLLTPVFVFLSHLCGGEVDFEASGISSGFLSHLCGGEDSFSEWAISYAFLSHLCGGEGTRF